MQSGGLQIYEFKESDLPAYSASLLSAKSVIKYDFQTIGEKSLQAEIKPGSVNTAPT